MTVVSYQLSVISYQLSVIGSQLTPHASRLTSSVPPARQVHDRRPQPSAESEGHERNEHGGGAPDDKARPQTPERAESRADHQHEGRREGIDVERAHPLPVLACERDPAGGTAFPHDEIILEERP